MTQPLPPGFVVEQQTPALPPGFVVEPQDRFGDATLGKVARGIDTVIGPLETFGQKATDMMTLGGLDEITALPGAAYDALTTDQSFGDAYGKRLTDQEARARMLDERNPVASVAGSVTGAVTSPAAQAGAKFINQGTSMLGRAGRAVIPGLSGGTVAGALGTEGDVGDRAEGAAWGAGTGAALAPIAQVGGELLGRFVSSLFRGKQALPAVPQGRIEDPARAAVTTTQAAGKVSASEMDAGVRRLLKALEADGVDVQKLVQAAQAGQLDDRTIAGVAGPNTRQMIDTYASMSGPAKTIVAGAQRAAEQGQAGAVTGAAQKALNVADDFVTAGQAVESQMQSASPLYKQAFANAKPVDTAPVISKIDAEIAKSKGGVRKALESARALLLDNAGNVDNTLEGLHNSKVALDDMYQAVKKDNSMGNIARGKVLGVIHDLLDAMDSSNPGYATARDTFAGPAAVEDAMDVGRNLFKEDWIKTAPDIAKMTASEKQGVRVGVVQAFRDMLDNVSDKADAAKRLVDYGRYLNRIRSAFPSKQAFDQFKTSLEGMTAEFQAIQMAGKGSQTAPRVFDALDQGIETAATGARAATGDKGSLLSLGKDAVRWLSAPNAQARAAAVSASLGKVPDVLPYLSGTMQRPAPSALGTALSGAVTYPASGAKARADALMGRGY